MGYVIAFISLIAITLIILYKNSKDKIYEQEKEINKLKEYWNEQQKEHFKELESEARDNYLKQVNDYSLTINNLSSELKTLRENLNNEIKTGKEQVDKEIQSYSQIQKIYLEKDIEKKTQEVQLQLEQYLNSIQQQKSSYEVELNQIKKELEEYHHKRESINNAILRERELEEKEDFYRLQISQDDIEDMELLKSMTSRLRHKELIPKLIWDSIVSRYFQEMCKRVITEKNSGGIYKITYLLTKEAYIGKTTNFKTRWQNHIGTALGLEKAASSTLHTHMAVHGIQNYSFEILEICSKEKQTEREKFYISLYGTTNQLNQRLG